MRYSIMLAALPLAACSTMAPEMAGFAEVAQGSEVVQIGGVGWGRSGAFTITPLGVTGRFHRVANASGAGGELRAEGHVRFQLTGSDEFARMSGECAYSRETLSETAEPGRRITVKTTVVTGPYVYNCGFYRGTEEIGTLEMRERPGSGLDIRLLRGGRADIGEARMTLESVHRFAASPAPAESPLGYAMRFATGQEAMLYYNGAACRLALPRAGGDERAAALLAGLALTLVWEPGDD